MADPFVNEGHVTIVKGFGSLDAGLVLVTHAGHDEIFHCWIDKIAVGKCRRWIPIFVWGETIHPKEKWGVVCILANPVSSNLEYLGSEVIFFRLTFLYIQQILPQTGVCIILLPRGNVGC